MKSAEIIINIPNGFHARPIAEFIALAKEYKSHVELQYMDRKANGRSILSMLALRVPDGGKMKITVEGEDEDIAFEALCQLLKTYNE